MDFKSLIDKIIENGKLILTQPTLLFKEKENILVIEEHEVKLEEKGRIDLIALQYYSSISKIDYLLKFNGISDPFSINEGDILQIPIGGQQTFKLERPEGEDTNIVRQQFTEGKRLTKKDKRRIEFLKKKYNMKEILPPNILKSNKKAFEFIEKEGESLIQMGMSAMTPETTFKSKSTTNGASKKANDLLLSSKIDKLNSDKKLNDIAKKDKLTDKDIAILENSGIKVSDLQNIKSNNIEKEDAIEGAISNKSFKTEKVVDGKMSTQKSEVYDKDKKTTTTTKTIVRPDGSSETIQTVTFSKSNDKTNSINLDK